MDSESHVRGFLIRGRVQGVGFRWWTRRTAEDLGVLGTVRNEADGSVRVRAMGDPAVLDRFADKLRAGPRFAQVDSVESFEPGEIGPLSDFRIEL